MQEKISKYEEICDKKIMSFKSLVTMLTIAFDNNFKEQKNQSVFFNLVQKCFYLPFYFYSSAS